MTATIHHADSALLPEPRRWHDATREAAEQFLTSTVDAVNPAASAPDLLACLTLYRAHLSALLAATEPASQDSSPRTPGSHTPHTGRRPACET